MCRARAKSSMQCRRSEEPQRHSPQRRWARAMRVEYDPGADAVYIELRPSSGPIETEFIDVARYIDYDGGGEVVGVELLGVSQGVDLEGLAESERIAEALRAVRLPDA